MALRRLLEPVLGKVPAFVSDTEIDVLQELPVETLYLALKEADSETALWFFKNARPEQVQGLVDLDCWQGDQFVFERYDTYFKLMTSLHPVKLGEYMKWLDPEVIVRGLMEYFEVLDFDPQNPPDVPEKNLMVTLDNKYALILKNIDPTVRETLYLWINKCSAFDLSLLHRHLESCKWEHASDLEEFAYQMKKGRMEELGFVERTEAISLYARGQAATFKRELIENPLPEGSKREAADTEKLAMEEDPGMGANEQLLPEMISEPFLGQGFLAQAFRKITNAKLSELLVMEIVRTVNMSLTADDLLFLPLEDIKQGSKRAKEYLDVGLTYLADGQIDDAADLLEKTPVEKIYRLGWLLVQDLVKASAELRQLHPEGQFLDMDDDLLNSLSGRHPELTEATLRDLELAPHSFGQITSLYKAGARVVQLSQMAHFFTQDLSKMMNLGAEPLSEGENFFARLLTALFRHAAGAELSSTPLNMEEWKHLLPKFQADAFLKSRQDVAGRVPAEARELFKKRLATLSENILAAVKNSGTQPDPRFFRALRWQRKAQA